VATVWTTCLLAFQTLLLLGYAYAHGLQSFLSLTRAWYVHCLLLLLSLWFLPSASLVVSRFSANWGLSWQVLATLLMQIGLPFVLLSATSPLFQWRSAQLTPGRSPYRLYASSNLGSLLGLLSYPIFVEPWVGLAWQTQGWTWGYVTLMAIFLWTAGLGLQLPRGLESMANKEPTDRETPTRSIAPLDHEKGRRIVAWVRWIFLSTGGCLILMASSAVLTQEVASFPFLWTVPLAAYLVSLIVVFGKPTWYRPGLVSWIFGLCAIVGLVLFHLGTNVSLLVQVLGLGNLCFWGTMLCHGELERTKPTATRLTEFYFANAWGGLLGGAICVLVAPRVFVGFFEFHVALLWGLLVIVLFVVGPAIVSQRTITWSTGMSCMLLGVVLLCVGQSWSIGAAVLPDREMIYRGRSDYGLVAVYDSEDFREIISGQTGHGRQYHEPGKKYEPQDYYGPNTGIGLAVRQLSGGLSSIKDQSSGQRSANLSWGIIGLGSGCLTTWGGQQRYYELDPHMVTLAQDYFTYLSRAGDTAQIVLGDGRLQLQREFNESGSQQFDLMVVDAFTSDSIPMHLLTRECLELYRSHLRPETGVLAIHITNRFVDLAPLFADGPLPSVLIETPKDKQTGIGSRWILMTQRQDWLANWRQAPGASELPASGRSWTDDFSSLFYLVDWSFWVEFQRVEKTQKSDEAEANH
jgi:hypothetical protein